MQKISVETKHLIVSFYFSTPSIVLNLFQFWNRHNLQIASSKYKQEYGFICCILEGHIIIIIKSKHNHQTDYFKTSESHKIQNHSILISKQMR